MSEPQIPTFVQNVDAFAQLFGPHEAAMIVDCAHLPWETSGQRDEFIRLMTTPSIPVSR